MYYCYCVISKRETASLPAAHWYLLIHFSSQRFLGEEEWGGGGGVPHHILSKAQPSELSIQVFTFQCMRHEPNSMPWWPPSIPGFPTTQKCILLPSSGLHCPAPFLRMKHESCFLESSSPASICPWTHLTCLTSLSCICDGCLPIWPILLISMDYSPTVSTDMLTR